jgi:hypothetical protein
MDEHNCKYCGNKMSKVAMPFDSDWNVEYLMICMNDECGYYKDGWNWMWNNYHVHVSYRFYINTFHNTDGPFPVSKPDDYKSFIVN